MTALPPASLRPWPTRPQESERDPRGPRSCGSPRQHVLRMSRERGFRAVDSDAVGTRDPSATATSRADRPASCRSQRQPARHTPSPTPPASAQYRKRSRSCAAKPRLRRITLTASADASHPHRDVKDTRPERPQGYPKKIYPVARVLDKSPKQA
jgi:hypothetical protein